MSQQGLPHPPTVPKFDSIEDAAEFWDTHSPLDYPDEFVEVELAVDDPHFRRELTIDLDATEEQLLREVAERRGIEPSALAQLWVLERLRNEPESAA